VSIVLGLFLAFFMFPSVADATALTYNVEANENACFYIMNDKPGKKIGFYFAVMYINTHHSINSSTKKFKIGPTRWFL
jgi:succinate dehydrogenase/fumarate reductase cytochrome b subunit